MKRAEASPNIAGKLGEMSDTFVVRCCCYLKTIIAIRFAPLSPPPKSPQSRHLASIGCPILGDRRYTPGEVPFQEGGMYLWWVLVR